MMPTGVIQHESGPLPTDPLSIRENALPFAKAARQTAQLCKTRPAPGEYRPRRHALTGLGIVRVGGWSGRAKLHHPLEVQVLLAEPQLTFPRSQTAPGRTREQEDDVTSRPPEWSRTARPKPARHRGEDEETNRVGPTPRQCKQVEKEQKLRAAVYKILESDRQDKLPVSHEADIVQTADRLQLQCRACKEKMCVTTERQARSFARAPCEAP